MGNHRRLKKPKDARSRLVYWEHGLENRLRVFLLVHIIARGKTDEEGNLARNVFIASKLQVKSPAIVPPARSSNDSRFGLSRRPSQQQVNTLCPQKDPHNKVLTAPFCCTQGKGDICEQMILNKKIY